MTPEKKASNSLAVLFERGGWSVCNRSPAKRPFIRGKPKRCKVKHKEPEATNAPDLGKLPEGWTWAPDVQATKIKAGRSLLGDTRYADQAAYGFWPRRCPPEPGDELLTREAPVGAGGIVLPVEKLCLGQRTMFMRPSAAISSSFLLSALLSPVIKDLIERVAVGSGVGHLRVGDMERLPVPLTPCAEQTRIVVEVDRHLFSIREVEAEVYNNFQRALALLAEAFAQLSGRKQ